MSKLKIIFTFIFMWLQGWNQGPLYIVHVDQFGHFRRNDCEQSLQGSKGEETNPLSWGKTKVNNGFMASPCVPKHVN